MHESALMANLIRKAEELARAEGATRVVAVRLRIGGLSEITEAHLREHFAEATASTMLSGARLDVEVGPGVGEAFEDPHARGVLLVGVDLEID